MLESVRVDWSNQKVVVTSLRTGDCKADGIRRQVARRDKEERELNSGKRRPHWCGTPWSPSSAAVCPLGPVESSGDQTKPKYIGKGKGKYRKKERCIRWGRRSTSPDIMTWCPLPSRHPLGELLCADGRDCVNVRDPIPSSLF